MMELSKAREINKALVLVSVASMLPENAAECDWNLLEATSLADMLEASRIMKGPAGKKINTDGSMNTTTTVADRGIALIYAAIHFPPEDTSRNCEPPLVIRDQNGEPRSVMLHAVIR